MSWTVLPGFCLGGHSETRACFVAACLDEPRLRASHGAGGTWRGLLPKLFGCRRYCGRSPGPIADHLALAGAIDPCPLSAQVSALGQGPQLRRLLGRAICARAELGEVLEDRYAHAVDWARLSGLRDARAAKSLAVPQASSGQQGLPTVLAERWELAYPRERCCFGG